MKCLIQIFLIFCFILKAQAIVPSPSTKSATRITQEELQRIVSNGQAVRVRYAYVSPQETPEEAAERKRKEDEDEERKEKEMRYDAWGDFFSHASLNTHDGRDFLVLFALAGAVVTVIWIASIPYTTYLAISGKEKYEYSHWLALGYSSVVSGTNDLLKRDGELSFLRYNMFFKKDEETINTGLVAESGYYELKDTDENRRITNNLTGMYWMLGPSAMIDFHYVALKLDLLGGTSFRTDLGIMAKADFSLLFRLNENLYLGGNFATQFIDVKKNKGMTSSGYADYLLGGTLTHQF